MTIDEIMQELAEAGSEQTRKIYRRHFVPEPMFGVSYAKLNELKKRIKLNQTLAEQLWDTGNSDARTLATMLAEPKLVTLECLKRWGSEANGKNIAHALAGVAAASPFAVPLRDEWLDGESTFLRIAAWTIVAIAAMDPKAMTEAEAASFLPRIEAELQSAPNWVKDAMHSALLAVGIRSDGLAEQAIASSERIGPITVDFGETSCKSPDTAPYIRKARAREHARKATRKA